MKNRLGDLNDHLFAQLERLNDEEMTGEKLNEEINRSKAIANVAQKIIENGQLVLDAKKIVYNSMDADATVPRMLEG